MVLALAMILWASVFMIRRGSNTAPATLTGPNLLPMDGLAAATAGDKLPPGWTSAGVGGVQVNDFTVDGTGHSISISGIANSVTSPWISVRAGASYRVALRALADNPDKPSPTRIRIRYHWRDSEGVEISNIAGDWQNVPYRQWATITSTAVAPAGAVQLAVSFHPASDDRVVIDQINLGQVGVRINPWPNGKRAALAFSFDYETEMGGLIHSRSVDDPNADQDPGPRAQRMRQGAEIILDLFAPTHIQGTWYSTGYNFLNGNQTCQKYMQNPTYTWASTANRWPTDYWAHTPWFASDPCTSEQSAPDWYFGSQIAELRAANQDIQSHTFAHFDGGLVTPSDWSADFDAWRTVAAAQHIAPATSLAFPWSSSAGMRWDSWEVLAAHGITSVTRTNWSQPRYRLADRDTYALWTVPGHATITVMADEYLTPGSLGHIEQRMQAAWLHEGAIDIWAHTEEVTSAAQQTAWRSVIAASERFWVTSLPAIVRWHQAIANVSIHLLSEEPQYTFNVENGNYTHLQGVTLILPFTPVRATINGRPANPDGDRLILDLPAKSTLKVALWRA